MKKALLLLFAALLLFPVLAGCGQSGGGGEDVDYKPVIYLYPEKQTAVDVVLEYDGRLTCTYPA